MPEQKSSLMRRILIAGCATVLALLVDTSNVSLDACVSWDTNGWACGTPEPFHF